MNAAGSCIASESPITPSAPEPQWIDEATGIPEFHRSVDTEHLSEIITRVADRLASKIYEMPEVLHCRIDTWCTSHGLDDTTITDRRYIAARQAVFNLLLKVTVHEWYHRRGELPKLPAGTWEIHGNVVEAGANHGFGECVLDHLILHADEVWLEVIEEHRDRLLASTQPAEDIGRLYEAVIPKEYQQSLSQFRTPPDIGQLMQSWAGGSDDTIMDLGIGAGVPVAFRVYKSY